MLLMKRWKFWGLYLWCIFYGCIWIGTLTYFYSESHVNSRYLFGFQVSPGKEF